jgi:hypothetical protein
MTVRGFGRDIVTTECVDSACRRLIPARGAA